MARKKHDLTPIVETDADGYQTDGMYRWRRPERPSPGQLQAQNEVYAQCPIERVRDHRKALIGTLAQYVDGPHDLPTAHGVGRRFAPLNLTGALDGKNEWYRIADGIDRHTFVDDAIVALAETYILERVLIDGVDINEIVRLSMRLGALVQRISHRMIHAPLLLAERKRRRGGAKGGKASAKWTPHAEQLARAIFAAEKKPNVSDDAAYRRTAAKLKREHDIDVCKDTVKRHLVKPPAQQ